MQPETKLSWDEFAATVADVVRLPPERMHAKARVVEDLGLDSLALTELIVYLIVERDMKTLSNNLGDRQWPGVTLGALFEELTTGRVPPRPREATVRLREGR